MKTLHQKQSWSEYYQVCARGMGSSFKGVVGRVLVQSQKCSTSEMKGPEEKSSFLSQVLSVTVPNSSTNRGSLKGNTEASL